jgi:energy-coupling factor transporter ATP-binding protein EcfA2
MAEGQGSSAVPAPVSGAGGIGAPVSPGSAAPGPSSPAHESHSRGAHEGSVAPGGTVAIGARADGVHARSAGAHARGASPRGGTEPEAGTGPGGGAGPGTGPGATAAGPADDGPGPDSTGPGSTGPGSDAPDAPPRGSDAAQAAPAEARAAAAPEAGELPDDDPAAPPTEPYVKVDARRLESALLALRHPIVTVPLELEAPGAPEARAERRKLLSQIDDYLLPRLRQSGAPILVALVGSTGAGKSTLMNSLVGMQVSQTGIRRPTTNSPVLACHPSDAHWFAENVFLPTLPRVRQQGLAMPGRDGLLVLAASEGMPRGIALLDTPDIDSVVQAHRDFAHQFLDATDLWLFMTSARRYADAAVWELLQDARDRAAALAVVLSRVPPSAARQLSTHFDAMLEANGLHDFQRFLIPETIVTDAMLPAEAARPVREWLEQTAAADDRRVAVLTQTMSGMLDTFRSRIPALAGQAGAQLALREELRADARGAYDGQLAGIGQATSDGSLLQGEVLTRWQDFAGTGDLMRTLQVRRGRAPGGKAKRKRLPARASALRVALRGSLESLIEASADRAAEDAVARWQGRPAGAALLSDLTEAAGAGRSAASDYLALALADLGMAEDAANESRPPVDAAALARSTPDLPVAAKRAVRAWQERVQQLVQAENITKRSVSRVVSFDHESLALVLMIGVLGSGGPAVTAGEAAGTADVSEGSADPAGTAPAESAAGTEARGPDPADAGTGPERLLGSLFGAGQLRDLTAKARADLHERVAALLAPEAARFDAVVDASGAPQETVAAQLIEASAALEAAR